VQISRLGFSGLPPMDRRRRRSRILAAKGGMNTDKKTMGEIGFRVICVCWIRVVIPL